jgi:hypothetical protein
MLNAQYHCEDGSEGLCSYVKQLIWVFTVVLSLRKAAQELGFSWSTFRQWLNSLGNYATLPKEVLIALAAIRRAGIAFYTFPINAGVPWLYLLTNVYDVDKVVKHVEYLKSLGINTSKVSIILDSGVERYWKKPCNEVAFDYDDDYWNRFWNAIDMLKSLRSEYWVFFEVTVPDYPDDYSRVWGKQHCLWVDNYTNIDRTLENVFYVIDYDKKVQWLLPAQGYENIPESILTSLETYASHGLHKRYRIALANLCTAKSDKVVVETIRIAREFCSSCSFHVFGAKLTAVAKALKSYYMKCGDSFDTFSWTFARSGVYVNRRGSQKYSAETVEEREFLFKSYLRRVADALLDALQVNSIKLITEV